jgi:hypothetical protein
MLWVTRTKIRVNRAATGWLVRRFIDPGASFRFLEATEVARFQADHGAIGFDAPGASYPHKDGRGRCSFEMLVEEYRPRDDALRRLAGIVHWADFPNELTPAETQPAAGRMGVWDTLSLAAGVRGLCPPSAAPEAVGLRAIARGFPLVAADDQETLERSAFLYDALYASIRGS